jgi:hypothetical protein
MRAYHNIRLTDAPDILDIQIEGRKSSVGRFDEKSYIRKSANKKAIRRGLKRRDRAAQIRLEQEV